MAIPQSELEKRVKLVKRNISGQYDALLVPLGEYFYYYFGKMGHPSERLIAGIIPTDGDPFIICPSFEKSNIQLHTNVDDIIVWEETESPYQILAKDLDERGIGERIAVDPHLWIVEAERMAAASNRKFVSSEELLQKQRAVKSDWEIQQLRKAAEHSTQGILAALESLKEGMTEIEFQKIVEHELSQRSGAPASFALVQFGPNSAIPHGMPSTKKLQANEVVLIDAGTSVNGYQGDITITTTHGNPEGFREIYEIVYEANRAALDQDREGIPAAELDGIARQIITNKGYGQYFTHRLGHGLGLEVHEHPYIVSSNQSKLVAGNTHTIEPGIYIPGKFGVRIEDDVLVKAKAELLYKTPRFNFE